MKQELLTPVNEEEVKKKVDELKRLKLQLEGSYFGNPTNDKIDRILTDTLSIVSVPTGVGMQYAFEIIKSTNERFLETLDSSVMNLFLNSGYILSTIGLICVIQRIRILCNEYSIKQEIEKLETEERIRASKPLLEGIEGPKPF